MVDHTRDLLRHSPGLVALTDEVNRAQRVFGGRLGADLRQSIGSLAASFETVRPQIEAATASLRAEFEKMRPHYAAAQAALAVGLGPVRPELQEFIIEAQKAAHHVLAFQLPHVPEFDPSDVVPEPKPGPAAQVLQVVQERLDAAKAEADPKAEQVLIVVTLNDGTKLIAEHMANEGDHLIQVEGFAVGTTERRTVLIGGDSLQVEFVTVKLPPKKPDLKLV
jgi:hypothetical protein